MTSDAPKVALGLESGQTFAEKHVIVLGAGIIGLSAARALLMKGFHVTIVAKHLPGSQDIRYTSNWAGASWSGKGESLEQRYIQAVGYRHLVNMSRKEPDAGVCLEPESYDSRFQYACEYDSPVVDPPIHLPFLKRQIEALGGRFVQREVASITELSAAYPDSDVVINASGLGARDLGGVNDHKVYPDRGQNVLVSSESTANMISLAGDEYTYIIPRPKSNILVCGGIHQPHNLNPNVEWDDVNDTIRRVNRAAPGLISTTPKVSSHVVGIRSTRDGGYRLEHEEVKISSQQKSHVLHAYGFGSSGYAHAYGVADALVKMVEDVELSETAGKFEKARL